MLKFDARWRFAPPKDGEYKNAEIPDKALREFLTTIEKVAAHGDRWGVFEEFKKAYSAACGESYMQSSGESWAESDMESIVRQAAENAPLFLDAFYTACESLRTSEFFTPDASMINAICEKHKIGYVLRPPQLFLREELGATTVAVPGHAPTLAEKAHEQLQESLQRSETLLSEGRYREAVQETLWVLESLSTTFRGVTGEKGTVKGKYFNDIVRDLAVISKGTTLERVIDWIKAVHGYLSSPTGGGVRHGLDLNDGVPIDSAEARLFCNLIRSYVSYLIAKHAQLQK